MSNRIAEIEARHDKYKLEQGFFAGYGNRESQDKVDISYLLAEAKRLLADAKELRDKVDEAIRQNWGSGNVVEILEPALNKWDEKYK